MWCATVALLLLVLVLLAAPAVQAQEGSVAAYMPGDTTPSVVLLGLDDPDNPYRGQYSLLDRWAYDNFCFHMTDKNCVYIQAACPNIEQALAKQGVEYKLAVLRSEVELDAAGEKGYMVPALAYTKNPPDPPQPRTLGQSLRGQARQVETPQAEQLPYFWSLGIKDQQAQQEYDAAVSAWVAPLYPPIADWMVAAGEEGALYSFLPDGGVAVAVPEVKGDFSQRMSQLCRYAADGKLLKQAQGDYMDWKHLLLNDVRLGKDNPYFAVKERFTESGRPAGSSTNSRGTGRYRYYVNEQGDALLAVIDYWQGKVLTPQDCDLSQLLIDPFPYFSEVEYSDLLVVHAAQRR